MTYWVMNIIKSDTVMQCYMNSKRQIFLSIEDQTETDEMLSSLQYICLDKEEATNLRNELDELIKEME